VTTDAIRTCCSALPHSREEVKWGNDLVFTIAGKMFAVAEMTGRDFGRYSFKCAPEEFEGLLLRPGIIPAPYLARAGWVCVVEPAAMDPVEAAERLRESYRLVASRLPKRVREEYGNPERKDHRP
jgi:predicted DNA-binding protein (MmcQ/YjbR family)